MSTKAQRRVCEIRCEQLNQELRDMGCPASIRKVHPYQDGGNELLRIVSSYRQTRPFYWMVTFEYRKPFTGKKGLWTIKFSTGAIDIVAIGDKILLKRQHRPTIGGWTWELPRAFTNLLVDPETARSDPIATLQAILHSEVDSVLDGNPYIEDIVVIDDGIFEDTGMSVVSCPVFLIKLKDCALFEDLDKDKEITWKLFTLEEVRRKIHDAHSKAAILSLMDKMEWGGLCLDSGSVSQLAA